MRIDEVIDGILRREVEPAHAPTEADWLATWVANDLGHADLDVMAALGGALSDRLAWVFLSGYQATVARCFPDLPRRGGWTSFVNTEDRSGVLPGTTLSGEGDARRLNGWKGWLAASSSVERLLVSAKQEHTPFVVLDRGTPGVRIEERGTPSYLPELTQGRVQFEDVVVPDDALTGDEHTFPLFRTTEGAYIRVALAAFMLGHARRLDAPAQLLAEAVAVLHASIGVVAQPMPSLPSLVAAHGADLVTQHLVASFEELLRERGPELLARWTRDRRLVTGPGDRIAARAAADLDALGALA